MAYGTVKIWLIIMERAVAIWPDYRNGAINEAANRRFSMMANMRACSDGV
jgi:hypothetical protein